MSDDREAQREAKLSELGIERLLYTGDVAKIYGIHPNVVPKMVKQKRIPKPLKARFGNGTCWKASVIKQHLEGLE